MNHYVDERIAFSYPEDLRCTWHPRSGEYHLRRGQLHIFITLPELEFRDDLFDDAAHVWQVPRGSLDSEGERIPCHEQWSEEYAEHGFLGRAKSTLSYSRFDEVDGKQIDLVLSRGVWRIYLRIQDDKDFRLTYVDLILETMAFPGEELYVDSQRLGPSKKKGSSPYTVSLKHFPKFGRKARARSAKFDVEYRGAAVSDQQLQALKGLAGDEERLYEQVKLAVFRYYTECIYPLVSKVIGPNAKLWPACETVDDVVGLVKLSSLVVHEPRDDGAVAIGLRFHCSWDEEHGMGVRAVGTTIEAIGTDFVALDSRLEEWPEFHSGG
jgi:hypothetical protein